VSPENRPVGRSLAGEHDNHSSAQKVRFAMRKTLSLTASLAGLCAVALVGACAEPEVESDEPSVGEAAAAITLPPPPPGAVCVTIERGVAGNMADADLSPGNGSWAAGAYPGLWTGGTTSPHWMVVKPNLSPIPPFSTIASATFSVYAGWSATSSTVRAHRVKADWSEATVSWPNFGGNASWDTAVLGSFNPVGVGYRSVDVTGLVTDWVAGAVPNQGLLLEEDSGPAHWYNSSESSSAAFRPRLDVCYIPGPCSGKPNGTACDDGDACTTNDACLGSLCVGGDQLDCGTGSCNPTTGACEATCPCRQYPSWHPDAREASCDVPTDVRPIFTLVNQGATLEVAEIGFPDANCTSPEGYVLGLTPEETQRCVDDLIAFDAMADSGEPPLKCACQLGGDGTPCSDGDPCTHGDTCQSGVCRPGTSVVCGAGEMCSAKTGQCGAPGCEASTCKNGGVCTMQYGMPTCDCPAGYAGPACEVPADPCAGAPCGPNGFCSPTDPFNYTCACNPGYTGTNCETVGCPCDASDPAWTFFVTSMPGVEVVPTSLKPLFEACDASDDTIDFSEYRALLPGVDSTAITDFQANLAALDPNDPSWCEMAHDMYTGLISTYGVYSAGSVTSTSNGVTTTTTLCMSTNLMLLSGSFVVTTPDQHAACMAEMDMASGGSVTPL